MTKERILNLAGLGAIAVAGWLIGYIFGGQTIDPNPALKEELDRANAKELLARDSIEKLLDRVALQDTASAELWQLYLSALGDADTIRLEYVPLYTRIAGADARLARHLSDSLRARYRANVARYRALLDTGGQSFDSARHGVLHHPGTP